MVFMAASPFEKLSADIAAIKKRIEKDSAELAELEKARAVLARYVGSVVDNGISDGEEEKRITVADRIENVLLKFGLLDANEVLEKLSDHGFETTLSSVTTNLSRLKSGDRLMNENGKWDLTQRRRKTLSK